MSDPDPVWPTDDDGDTINLERYNPKFYRDFETQFPDEITWYQHIQGLFTESNARCMISKDVNLASYKYVSNPNNYKMIWYKLTSSDPKEKMPPGDPWSKYQIELFRRWGLNPVKGDKVPSATDYSTKIIRPPLRYQYPETLPVGFIATFYQNVKSLFTTCDQKFGMDALDKDKDGNYNVNVFDYNQLRDAANAAKDAEMNNKLNIINDIRGGKFPKGSPWPQTWINVLNNWIENGCERGVPPRGMEDILVESD